MSFLTPSASQQIAALVSQWQRRQSVRVALIWLPRSVLPALIAGVTLALYTRWQVLISDGQIIVLTVGLILAGVLAVLGWLAWRRQGTLNAAQSFDRRFGLGERVSTALEISTGTIHTEPEIARLQVDDALNRARSIQPAQALPYRVEVPVMALVVALALGLFAVLGLIAPAQAQPTDDSQSGALVAQAVEEVRDAIETIATDTGLTEPERQQLLEALQSNLRTLQDENISLEEAFATLRETQMMLGDQADALREQAEMSEAGLSAAQQALDDTLRQQNQASDSESAAQAAQNVANALENLTAEQLEQLSQALEQAADNLQGANSEAAQALEQAAQSLSENDLQSAREALEQASRSMQQQARDSQQQQSSAQNLEQSAERLQDMQESQDSSGDSGEGEEGEGGGGQESESEGGEGESGSGDSSGDGGNQGSEGGEGAQASDNGDGSSSSAPTDQSSDQIGDGASGAGTAEGDLTEDSQGMGQAQDMDASNNQPSGEAERQYEPVFAPRSVNPTGRDEIRLETDPGDTPIGEGEFSPNPDGRSVVPYNEVFSEYSSQATRALDADYIPLGLRDVIRLYFSSLDPNQR